MDTITIVLIVIIVVLVYFLYRSSKSSSTVSKATVLNLNNSNSAISNTTLTNSSSTRFSYESWVCVNTWNNTIAKTIYLGGTSTDPVIKLSLAETSPTLTCTVKTSNTSASKTTSVVVTKNFPVQKWVYIVISVDNTVIDCYLDGKLVTSQQLPNVAYVTDSYDISFGVFDASLTGFLRNAFPLDPQTVWTKYMSGNGISSIGSSYGLTAAITKDGSSYSTLF